MNSKHPLHQLKRWISRVLLVGLMWSMSGSAALAASSWNPTLLVNTESFNSIDDGDGTTDIELRFGDTGNLRLFWDVSDSHFEFTRPVYVQGDLTASGALTINDDDTGDAIITFGNTTLDETLKFNATTGQFEFSDDVNISGTASGSHVHAERLMTTSGALVVEEGQTFTINGNTYTFPLLQVGSGRVLKTDGNGQLTWSTDVDTNAQTLCDANEYLDGDGNCVDVIEESELGSESDLETQLGAINVIVETEIDSESELESLLVDVTNVYTNNDGILYTESVTDNRYVRIAGDTMTGALLIKVGEGNEALEAEAGLGLEVVGTASGEHLHAERLLTSSGTIKAVGAITTDDQLQINADDTGDATLTFGSDTADEFILFDNTQDRFEFSDDIQTPGSISGSTLTVDGQVTIHGVTYTFPTTNGDNGEVLTTDGNGTLSWTSQTVGVGSGGVVFLSPEYPHAVYFSSGSVTNFIGQLTYDRDETNQENYYHWTSTKADLQEYWISAQIRVPDNFSTWDDARPIQLRYRTGTANAADNYISMRMIDTAGVNVALTGAEQLKNTSWTTAIITGPEAGGTFTAGSYVTIFLKLVTTSAGSTDAGYISLNWETSAP
ncbi:hypothetical protein COU80_00020 [Candidatus Peregrinibacteria bacterium CG10_big_fil_rev_8_21_14_0_10_55_24]|nr:MAG: hypothetical protein COU80_00020 [Candidatus Peregrinibacteria bacterium CG10_big_fil_rev_8_21_14_0_10_55_24]